MEMSGIGACSGIAIGRLHFVRHRELTFEDRKVQSLEDEALRLEQAMLVTATQLEELQKLSADSIGAETASVFVLQRMLLRDQAYDQFLKDAIEKRQLCAENAVCEAAVHFSSILTSLGDAYISERAADITDLSRRLLDVLEGAGLSHLETEEPCILISDDFSPSETAQFEKSRVLAVVTREGTANSHAALISRTLGIPAVVGLRGELDYCLDGELAVVDGHRGLLFIDPDNEIVGHYVSLREEEFRDQRRLESMRGLKSTTTIGREINLFANISNTRDIDAVLRGDAEGVGLLRSEYIYLMNEDFPGEEEQFEAYRYLVRSMHGKPVIIRTLDAGSDKQAPYFGIPHQANPALGLRGIRLSLRHEDIFRVQLRALLRASTYGDLRILFPLVVSPEELLAARKILRDIMEDLSREGIAFREDIPVGIMIETPAAAVISDLLAPHCDFFSIGTNDLAQYTLAVDRLNTLLLDLFDARHEAVLRLIEQTVKNAKAQGIAVGICGDLAADPELTRLFIEWGIDYLSMPPFEVMRIRQKIRSI